VKYFKQYLLGRDFKKRTDHAPLTWLRHTPQPIGQQARWLEILEEYRFDVEHRPGNIHMNADALSRRPCRLKSCICHQEESEKGINTNRITVSAVTLRSKKIQFKGRTHYRRRHARRRWRRKRYRFSRARSWKKVESPQDLLWSWNGLREAHERDPAIGRILTLFNDSTDKPSWETVAIHSQEVHVLWSMWPRLRVNVGVLQRKFESPDGSSIDWQTVIPKAMREDFLQHVHGGMTSGHLGRE